MVPESLPDGLYAPGTHFDTATINMSYNPITHIPASAFNADTLGCYVRALNVDLRYPTTGRRLLAAPNFTFQGMFWDGIGTGGVLNLTLEGTRVNPSIVWTLPEITFRWEFLRARFCRAEQSVR